MSLFLFITSIFLPFGMSLIGAHLRRNPPKTINWVYGYRTTRSMSSPEAWDYANRRCGEVWVRGGLAVGAISALVAALFWQKLEAVSLRLVCLQLLFLFLTILVVERDLKQRFGGRG